MTDHVRWGILGAAKFAREHMAPAIQLARGGRFSALATSDPVKAEPFAAMAPGLKVHGSYEALLADRDIDAVYIPLPNTLHVEWTLKALEAGKHVLCEKPIAMVAAEIDPIIARRDETGLLAAEAYMIVHHPQWQTARDLFRSGVLGTVSRVEAAFSYNNADDTGNIRNRSDTGGGALPDIGVYIFGSTRFVTGEEPERIIAAQIERENGVDVYSHVTARFPSFHYAGMVSMRLGQYQQIVFHGDKAAMRLTAPYNPQVYGEATITLHLGGREEVLRFPAANHYVNQVEAFNTSVLTGAAYPCPLEFSRGTQAMIDMVLAAEGK